MKFQFFLHEARRYALMAVLPALLVALVTGLYVHRESKVYSASTTLYVQQPAAASSNLLGGTDVASSTLVTPTFSQMITDPVVTGQVDRMMQRDYPGYSVDAHQLSTNQQPGVTTQLVQVSIRDTIPARAAAAVNAVAQVFIKRIAELSSQRFANDADSLKQELAAQQQHINTITQQINDYRGDSSGLAALRNTLNAYTTTFQNLQSTYAQFRVQRDAYVNTVSVYSPATTPSAPIGPHPERDALLAGIVTLLLAVAVIRGYEYIDDSFRSPEEVEEIIGAPILGTVMRFEPGGSGAPAAPHRAQTAMAEAYRVVRTNLQFAALDREARRILITSAKVGEGKSTTASNLARVFAEGGVKVTLIDADLRRPTLHSIFGMERKNGLTSMLMQAHLNGDGPRPTDLAGLRLVTAGSLSPNPADILGSQRMKNVLDHLSHNDSEVVLIDSPPVLPVADATILSTLVDGVILVVDLNQTKRRELQHVRDSIEGVGGKILGVVVNRLTASGSGYYYHRYYSYGYGYGYANQYASSDAEVREASAKARVLEAKDAGTLK